MLILACPIALSFMSLFCPTVPVDGVGLLSLFLTEFPLSSPFAAATFALLLGSTLLPSVVSLIMGRNRLEWKKLGALRRVAVAAAQAQEESAILREGFDAFLQATRARPACLYLVRDWLQFVTALRHPAQADCELFPPELLQSVVTAGEVRAMELGPSQAPGDKGRLKGHVIGVPLLAGRKVLGVLCGVLPGSWRPSPAEEAWFTLLGTGIGIAVENSRLFLAEQQDLSRLVALQEIHRALSSTLELAQLAPLLLEKICGFFEVEAADLFLADTEIDRLILAASYGTEGGEKQKATLETKQNLARRVVEQAKLLLIPDVRSAESLPGAASSAGHITYLGVPLMIQERLIGVLALYSSQGLDYDEEQIGFLSTISGLAATAIDNARLFQEAQAAEAEARQEATYRQRVMESMVDGLFVLDPAGRMVEVNGPICEMTGFTRQELIQLEPPFPCCPEEEPKFVEAIASCAAGTPVGPLEMSFQRKDGARFPVEVTFSPFVNEQGTFIGCVGVVRDITVVKRTRAELLQAAKLAAVGRLVSGVAHELSNPLTAIVGSVQFLKEEVRDEQALQDLKVIETQAERASRIVRNLLSFARSHEPERTYIDVNKTLQSALDLVAYQFEVDGVHIVQQMSPDLPWTMADPYQMQQVILNLLTNAKQAIKSIRSTGTITVTTEVINEKTLRFSCADDGPGIPAEILEQLFQPFVTSKEQGEGTGLGLSICYRIVSEHGGRIWVETEEGRGTTFFVELPVIHLTR